MALENLYSLTEEEISSIYKDFADNFASHIIFTSFFKNTKKRKKLMEIYFQAYIQMIAPYCTFYADSIQKENMMVILDTRKYQKGAHIARMIKMYMKLSKMVWIDISAFIHIIKNRDILMSQWVDEFIKEPYLHLKFIYVKEYKQRHEMLERMLLELKNDAQILHMNVAMEVYKEEGLKQYEELGFALMNTISYRSFSFQQYCLIMQYKE